MLPGKPAGSSRCLFRRRGRPARYRPSLRRGARAPRSLAIRIDFASNSPWPCAAHGRQLRRRRFDRSSRRSRFAQAPVAGRSLRSFHRPAIGSIRLCQGLPHEVRQLATVVAGQRREPRDGTGRRVEPVVGCPTSALRQPARRFAMRFRTSGTSSTGTSMAVWVVDSNPA